MNDDDVQNLLREADIAFWDVVARHFPNARGGDLDPVTTVRLTMTQEEAIREWIANNVTTNPSAINPGYRFKLFHEVDRSPNFRASAGLSGALTTIDDSGVWARMDDSIAGAEKQDNQIHWPTPQAFAKDTVPL